MFFHSYSPIIDEKLKNYIKKINNSFIERYTLKQKPLILDSSNKNYQMIAYKPLFIYSFSLAFSFFTGYHFRSLVDYYK